MREYRFRGDLWNASPAALQAVAERLFGAGARAEQLMTGLWVDVTKPDGRRIRLCEQQVKAVVWA